MKTSSNFTSSLPELFIKNIDTYTDFGRTAEVLFHFTDLLIAFIMGALQTGRSAVWSAHSVRDAGVMGSNPIAPIFIFPKEKELLISPY
jgi:hypothetical protein